jgi:hypothetical protein
MVKSDYYDYGGIEAGGKLLFGPVYASCSAVLANPRYNRIEIGAKLSNLLKL